MSTEHQSGRKKRELVFFPSQGGATGTVVHRLDATRTKSQTKHTQFYKQIHGTIKWWSCITKHSFRIIDVPLPSTGSWLPSHLSSTWSWAERIERIFSNSKYTQKSGTFDVKSGMAVKSVCLRPKAVMLTPMQIIKTKFALVQKQLLFKALYYDPFRLSFS